MKLVVTIAAAAVAGPMIYREATWTDNAAGRQLAGSPISTLDSVFGLLPVPNFTRLDEFMDVLLYGENSYEYCDLKLADPCEDLKTSTAARQVKNGIFCPPVGYCVNIRALLPGGTISTFIDDWVLRGRISAWDFCAFHSDGFSCDAIGSNFSRTENVGLFYRRSGPIVSTSTVNVSLVLNKHPNPRKFDNTTSLQHPKKGASTLEYARELNVTSVPSGYRRKYIFMLALISSTLLETLFELWHNVAFLGGIIYSGNLGTLWLWLIFQRLSIVHNYAHALMFAILFTQDIRSSSIFAWLIVLCATMILSTGSSIYLYYWARRKFEYSGEEAAPDL